MIKMCSRNVSNQKHAAILRSDRDPTELAQSSENWPRHDEKCTIFGETRLNRAYEKKQFVCCEQAKS